MALFVLVIGLRCNGCKKSALTLCDLKRCQSIERASRSSLNRIDLDRRQKFPALQTCRGSGHVLKIAVINDGQAQIDLGELMNGSINTGDARWLYIIDRIAD